MNSTFTYYKTKLNFYNHKQSTNNQTSPYFSNNHTTINSDINIITPNKNTLRLQTYSTNHTEQDHGFPNISLQLAQKIRLKSSNDFKSNKFNFLQSSKNKLQSPFVSRMKQTQKYLRKILVYKTSTKNVKQLKIQKLQTSGNTVSFHKNSHKNKHIKLSEFGSDKNQLFSPRISQINQTFMVLGRNSKYQKNIEDQETKLMSLTLDLPRVSQRIKKNNQKVKKFHTISTEKMPKEEYFEAWKDTTFRQQSSLANFIKFEKLPIKKRPQKVHKKHSRSFVNQTH